MVNSSYGSKQQKYPIYEKIDDLRRDKNMSYTVLADLLGVTRQTVANYCTGKTKTIPSDILDQLCDIFDVSQAYFFTDGNIKAPDYFIHVICNSTGLSEKAASALCVSDAHFPLNYMLEHASPDFWRALNAYFSLSIKRKPAFLEIDPISLEFEKHMGDLEDLEYDGKLDGDKYHITNEQLLEDAFYSIITGEIKSLKKDYWSWFLSQKHADSLTSPEERMAKRKKAGKKKKETEKSSL